MELLEFLNKSIQDRFTANAIVEAIELKIQKEIERKIFKIYFSKKIHYENLDFELIGVQARCSTSYSAIVFDNEINVELNYICVSKLPKDKQQKVEDAKKNYNERKHFGYSNLKVQLWHSLNYTLSLREAIEIDNIGINIVF